MSSSLTDQFAHIAISQNLRTDSKKYRKARNQFIIAELETYMNENGHFSKLEAWQKLCRDLGIKEDNRSITQCKKVSLISHLILSYPPPS